MATHTVTFQPPLLDLGKTDITFRVEQDGELLGTLYVSKGALAWQPKNGKKKFKIGWAKLHQLMQDNGSRVSGQ